VARKPLGIPTASGMGMLYRCPASFWGDQPDYKEQPAGEAASVGTKVHKIMEKCVIDDEKYCLKIDKKKAYQMSVEMEIVPEFEALKVDECLAEVNKIISSLNILCFNSYGKEVVITPRGICWYVAADCVYDNIRAGSRSFVITGLN